MLTSFIQQYWWLVLIALATSILKLFAPMIKGKIGEGFANLSAKLHLDPNIYHLIKDVTIPAKKGTTQIDHVVVSVYGLFVIETKNYKGWIFGDAKSRNWTQVHFKQKNRFQNPLHQNHAHICALSDLLGISRDTIHGVVCFMGDAKFKTDIPEGVFIQSRYISHIQSFQTPVFSKEEVADILQQIESGRLKRGFKTNRQHVRQLKTRHTAASKKTLSETPSQKACPACAAEMVLRTAKRKRGQPVNFRICVPPAYIGASSPILWRPRRCRPTC